MGSGIRQRQLSESPPLPLSPSNPWVKHFTSQPLFIARTAIPPLQGKDLKKTLHRGPSAVCLLRSPRHFSQGEARLFFHEVVNCNNFQSIHHPISLLLAMNFTEKLYDGPWSSRLLQNIFLTSTLFESSSWPKRNRRYRRDTKALLEKDFGKYHYLRAVIGIKA